MFKELIEVLQGKETLFDEIKRDFEEMIFVGHQMFDLVTSALLKEGEFEGDLKKEIYKLDALLNGKEQSIRQAIMTILSAGSAPIAACLILMSVSKDAERLGDYSKNILQVFEAKPHLRKGGVYYDQFVELRGQISLLFGRVLKAYHESDKIIARALYKESYAHQKKCDEILKELLLAKPEEDHVAHAVLIRFSKRILGHLSNISTSVFMPVTKIDFFDNKKRDEEGNR